MKKARALSRALLLSVLTLAATGCGGADSTPTTAPVAAATATSIVASAPTATTEVAAPTATKAPAANSKPFKVLMVQDLSGALSSIGKAEVQGMKASAEVINAQGGILGRMVQVDAVDDQADATKAVSLLTERITNGDIPDMVQGGTGSSETLAMLPIMTKNKILYVGQNGGSAINDPAKYPYAFSINVPETVSVNVVTQFLKDHNYKKIGVMQSNSASGQSEMKAFEKVLPGAGITWSVQTFDPTSLDMTPQLEALKADNPDALVTVTAFGRGALTLLSGRQKIGWDVPVVGDIALSAQNLAGSLGLEALNGVNHSVFMVQKYVDTDKRSAAFNTFFEALKKQGPITASLNVYSFSYDELQVLNEAAKQAQSTDHDALAKAMESLQTPSPAPWVTFQHVIFSPTNHFNAVSPSEAQVIVQAGPIEEGMFK
ncbi:MAG: ABC transporter substrate-binding protein [Chloroflexia bacterium]